LASSVAGNQSLAAQHAVLVGERKPHQFELVLLDVLRDRRRGLGLFVGPELVAVDEGQRGGTARRHA
jgi:hypothetical protein